MPRQQLQAARVQQQPALAAGLRAGRAASLGMGELLVLAEGGDVLLRETQAVVGDGRGRCGLRRRAHMAVAMAGRVVVVAVGVVGVVVMGGGGGMVRRGRHQSITAASAIPSLLGGQHRRCRSGDAHILGEQRRKVAH